jgi:enterochelin esterase family protein
MNSHDANAIGVRAHDRAQNGGRLVSTGGTVVIATIESSVLAGNPLGDRTVREVPIYLPPSYDRERDRRYPVLYCLTGFTGRGKMLLNAEPFTPNLPERLDAMMASGRAGEAIVVMPDCMTRLGGSQYVNSTATGRYEDHILEELVPYVDTRFRTLAERDARGVLGKSSGGYGAMWLGMRHPDIFGAVACHSGDMYFEYCYRPDVAKAVDALQNAGGLEAWFRSFEAAPKKTSAHHDVLNIVAMAACYSPDPSEVMGIALPFDSSAGEFREDVWARWLQFDPVHILPRHADALRSLRLLFIDCGTKDEFRLHLGARIFTRKLSAMGIEHEYQEFDDGHMQIAYRYEVSIPKLTAALGAVTA